ncbi:colicin V production protein [Oscillochloris trichoides DG-6]|uniref:Colicin V production protein n=1 Tax=Oscillochloris trichoides DG-6 TaxID=765420 RepID=E1IC89_9CHLR|nr:CvpA family protein [Oscillochloris trichoides]EFO81206.1 colicin V production protein [Oscillochloris trichoides DG-6]
MNLIDILFLLLFVGSLIAGYFQGMIRQAILLVTLYLSLVLASLYYTSVGLWLVKTFSADRFVGQYVGFTLVLFFCFLSLSAAGLYTFRYAHLPGGLRHLDHAGGMILGMLLGTFIIGTFAAVLYNMMIVRGGARIDLPLMRWLGDSVATSFVLQYFARDLLSLVYSILDPILPQAAQIIFMAQ